MSSIGVRLAEEADADAVADTLGAAFATSPWTEWAIPADDRRHRLWRLHHLFAGRIGAATRTTWVTDDVSCVAQWIPPVGFAIPADLRELLLAEESTLLGHRAPAVAALEELTRAARPAEPHWWLGTLGTLPERQRQGLGARLLAPTLQRIDDEDGTAALETSTTDNVRFYERLGFAVDAHYHSPDGELPVWLMVRRPG